jgi:hypothetical protein
MSSKGRLDRQSITEQSVVLRASGLVFMFCAPGLVFGSSEGVRSCFYVLRPWTRFRRFLGRRVPFSYFVLPDSFSAVPRASAPVFMFCAPELVSRCTEGVGSRFHVCTLDSFSAVRRASGSVFIFCVPRLIFCGSECLTGEDPFKELSLIHSLLYLAYQKKKQLTSQQSSKKRLEI